MEGMMRNLELDTLLPTWVLNAETQAVILTGLCGVGAWVIFKWVIQILFSVLWPFLAVSAVMVCFPTLRQTITQYYLPRQIATLKRLTTRVTNALISTYRPEN